MKKFLFIISILSICGIAHASSVEVDQVSSFCASHSDGDKRLQVELTSIENVSCESSMDDLSETLAYEQSDRHFVKHGDRVILNTLNSYSFGNALRKELLGVN